MCLPHYEQHIIITVIHDGREKMKNTRAYERKGVGRTKRDTPSLAAVGLLNPKRFPLPPLSEKAELCFFQMYDD